MNPQGVGAPARGGTRFKGICKAGSPDKPLVTVIVPVLNAEKNLERCISSVIQQSYANIEFIVIDGGSTDRSLDIINKYENRIDYWQSEPDRGIYHAMNKGIHLSNGDWIYFLGADDTLFPNIEKIVTCFKNSETIYYGNVLFKNKKKLYDGKFNSFKLATRNICHQAIFYPKVVFNKCKFNTDYQILADWEFNMRCHKDNTIKYAYMPFTVATYNYSIGKSFTINDEKFFDDYTSLVKKYFPYWVYLLSAIKHKTVIILKRLGILKYINKTLMYFNTI